MCSGIIDYRRKLYMHTLPYRVLLQERSELVFGLEFLLVRGQLLELGGQSVSGWSPPEQRRGSIQIVPGGGIRNQIM